MVRLILGLLLNLFTAPLIAQQATPTEMKAKLEVEELEKRWLASERDAEVLKVVLAEDFVFVSPTGLIGKEQLLRDLKKHHSPAHDENRRFDDLRIRVYGEVAIVNGTIAATETKNNSVRKFLFTDVFIHRDGRWQAINTQRTALASVNQ